MSGIISIPARSETLPWAPHLTSRDLLIYRVGIVTAWLVASTLTGASAYTLAGFFVCGWVKGALGASITFASALFLKAYAPRALLKRSPNFKYCLTEGELKKFVSKENFGHLLAESDSFAWTRRLLVASRGVLAGIVTQHSANILRQIADLPTVAEQHAACIFFSYHFNLSAFLLDFALLDQLPDNLRREWIINGGSVDWAFLERCPHNFVDDLRRLNPAAVQMNQREFEDALASTQSCDRALWVLKQRPDCARALSTYQLRSILHCVAKLPTLEDQIKAVAALNGRVQALSPRLCDSLLLEQLNSDMRGEWIASNGSPRDFKFYFDAPDSFIEELTQLGFTLSSESSFCLPKKLPENVANADIASCRLRFALLEVDLIEETMRWSRSLEHPWEYARAEQIIMRAEGQQLSCILKNAKSDAVLWKFVTEFYKKPQHQRALIRAIEACSGEWGRSLCLSFAESIVHLRASDFMHLALIHPGVFTEEVFAQGFDRLDWKALFVELEAGSMIVDRLSQEERLFSKWAQRPSFTFRLALGLQTHFIPLLQLFARKPQLWAQLEYAMGECEIELLESQIASAKELVFAILQDVVSAGSWDLLKVWRRRGLSLDIQDPGNQESLLHRAVKLENVEAVSELLRLGVCPHIRAVGQTPMDLTFQTPAARLDCALRLAPHEKALTDQSQRFIQLFTQLKALRSQLGKVQAALDVAEQNMQHLDSDGRIGAVAAAANGLDDLLREIQRAGISEHQFRAWQRALTQQANASAQIDILTGKIAKLETLIRLLAPVGPVHRPKTFRGNLVCEAIRAGCSAEAVAELLYYGGSLFAPGENGRDPMEEAYIREDRRVKVVLGEAGALGYGEPPMDRYRQRLIVESSYHRKVEKCALQMLEGLSPNLLKILAPLAVERGSNAVFSKIVKLRPEGVDLARAAFSTCNYERLASCAQAGLVTDALRIKILRRADAAALAAVGNSYPKGSLKALLSSTSNLEARLALIGEIPLSKKAAPDLAQFLERTLPPEDHWMTKRDFKHYYSLISRVAPGLPEFQSTEDLRRMLNTLMVRSKDAKMDPTTSPTTSPAFSGLHG